MILLNYEEIKPTIFPDKTSQVWKLDESLLKECKEEGAIIEWRFNNEAELIHLLQLRDLLVSLNIRILKLTMPYFPYARQDKPVSNTSTFALKTFCNILGFYFKDVRIETCDPHFSGVPEGIKKPLIVLDRANEIFMRHYDPNRVNVVYPDKGAYARYVVKGVTTVVFEKKRDQLTGNILSYKPVGQLVVNDLPYVIIDDICDGGRTFIEAAKYLYAHGAKQVDMVVTHGIFSQTKAPLYDAGIKNIITKDS